MLHHRFRIDPDTQRLTRIGEHDFSQGADMALPPGQMLIPDALFVHLGSVVYRLAVGLGLTEDQAIAAVVAAKAASEPEVTDERLRELAHSVVGFDDLVETDNAE